MLSKKGSPVELRIEGYVVLFGATMGEGLGKFNKPVGDTPFCATGAGAGGESLLQGCLYVPFSIAKS